MKLTRAAPPNWALFGIIPIVNVIFLVMVFFALGSRYIIQPGVAVTLPASPFKLAPHRNPRIVSITSAPAPAIYFQDRQVTREELARTLAGMRTGERTLIVKADSATPYESIVAVMNEGLKLGYSVVLAGSEPAE